MAAPAFTVEPAGFASSSAAGEPGADRPAIPDLRMEFEKIVQQGLPQFRRVAMRWLRNPEDAEDAVQDAMLSAFRHIAAFDGRARMSTWVMAIVINAVRMQLRRRPRCHFLSLDHAPEEGRWTISEMLADPRPTPEQTAAHNELRDLAARLTRSLPDAQRAAIRLRQLGGLSIREAAEKLGVPEGTLKAQLARGRAKLVQRFRKAAARPRTKAAIHDTALKRREKEKEYCRPESLRCVVPVPITGFQQQGGYESWVGA
jgi:RNA polymerase sigma-70 factor (ECF subfamily)